MVKIGVEKYLDDINVIFPGSRWTNCKNGRPAFTKMYEF
jgi:hypothetical protein